MDVLFPGPFKLGKRIVGSSKVLLNVAIFLKWKSNWYLSESVTYSMMLLTHMQEKRKNSFDSAFPSYAKGKCFPEYSWAFLKQTSKKEKAGSERLYVEDEKEVSKGPLGEGWVSGRWVCGACEGSVRKTLWCNLKMSKNWRREGSSFEALQQAMNWISFNVLQETHMMV